MLTSVNSTAIHNALDRARKFARQAALLAVILTSVGTPVLSQETSTANAAVDLKTLAGEQCAITTGAPGSRDRLISNNSFLQCSGRDVGQVLDVRLPGGAAPDDGYGALAQIFAVNQSRILDKNILTCEPPRQLPEELGGTGAPVIVAACRNNADGWPQLVMGRVVDGKLRLARGPATALPALTALLGGNTAEKSTTAVLAAMRGLWPVPVVIGSVADQTAIQSRWDLARLASARLDHVGAERELRQAVEIQTRLFGETDPVSNAILLDLAIVIGNQGRAEEAEALIRRVTPALTQSPRRPDRARLASYKAQLAAMRGDFAEAQAEAGNSTAQWRTMAEPPPTTARSGSLVDAGDVNPSAALAELGLSLNLEAAITLRMGDASSAAVRASEALLTFSKAPGAPIWWKADILATLGEASSELGRLSAAEQYLKSAIQIRREIFGEGAGTLRLTLALAKAYHREGLSTNAVLTFRNAMTIATSLQRDSIPISDNDLIPFAETIADLANKANSDQERQGLYSELFAAFQLARSSDRQRTAVLAAANLETDSPQLAALLREISEAGNNEAQARVALSDEQGRPAEERNAERAEALAKRLADTSAQLIALRAGLIQKFPEYQSLVQPQSVALDELRARLTPDEALAMFIVGQSNSFLMLAQRGGLTLAPIPAGAASLSDAVRALRRGLEIEGRSVNEFDLSGSRSLFDMLFGGAKPVLATIKRLTVIPANALASLPFAVLVDGDVSAGNYRSAPWLVRRMAVAHAPTLSSFMLLRSTKLARSAPLPFLGVANPVLAGRQSSSVALARAFAGCRTSEPMDPQLLRSLTSLPETGREVESVARALGIMKPDLLLADGATEPAVRAKKLDDYRILYFATHGLVPGELQCQNEPGLVLTPPKTMSDTRLSDGLLDASEIAKLSLRADLVVLSACNTAAPQAAKLGGGSLSGLAESFFRAGARSVLATHWQVPSQATAQLMRDTFGRLGAEPEMAIDEALRQAQLLAVNNSATAHPFFWGAFVVLGDGAGQPLAGGVLAQ